MSDYRSTVASSLLARFDQYVAQYSIDVAIQARSLPAASVLGPGLIELFELDDGPLSVSIIHN